MSKLGIIVGVTGSAGLGMAVEHLFQTFERHMSQQAVDDGILVLHAASMSMGPYDRVEYLRGLKRDMDSRDLHRSRRKPSIGDELKIRFGN